MSNSLDNWQDNPSFNAMAEKHFYPPEFEIGWEHYKSYRHCIFCGGQEHESNLILCKDGNWRHQVCDEKLHEMNENFKHKKP